LIRHHERSTDEPMLVTPITRIWPWAWITISNHTHSSTEIKIQDTANVSHHKLRYHFAVWTPTTSKKLQTLEFELIFYSSNVATRTRNHTSKQTSPIPALQDEVAFWSNCPKDLPHLAMNTEHAKTCQIHIQAPQNVKPQESKPLCR
jgi:hypothetical protein